LLQTDEQHRKSELDKLAKKLVTVAIAYGGDGTHVDVLCNDFAYVCNARVHAHCVYSETFGSSLPYRQFGYNNVAEFIKTEMANRLTVYYKC
jgi:hypothetical protein